MIFHRTYIIISLFYLFVNISVFAQEVNSRSSITVNNDWKFCYTGKDIKVTNVLDTEWKHINIPHTWNINDTPNDTTTYKRGIGWYKKTLRLSNSLKNKRVYLHFEGANQIAELFVNGTYVGKHLGGYTAFSFDITNYIHFDDESNSNEISVKIDNRFNKDIPPLSADFTFYGGIYRDVWLIATNPVHFSLNDYGSKGVYIATPKVTKNEATVKIHGKIHNQSNVEKEILIRSKLFNKKDSVLHTIEKNLKITANHQVDFSLDSILVNKPELWSPDQPNLYTVRTELFEKGHLKDEVISPLGFRFFNFHADKGVFLNGKPIKLIGTNRHQDHETYGNALSNKLHVKDLEMIKDAGFNFLRLAHYPQDPEVLHAADKLGIIIWEEIPIVNYVTTSDAFLNNSKYMLTEMIRQSYNHPSIFFWGYMNEVFLYDANGDRNKNMNFPDTYLEWTKDLAKQLNTLVKKEDSSRITVMAIHQNDKYDEVGISKIPDALGYNLYQGWYSNYFTDFGNFLDRTHLKYPKRKIVISEYGAGSDERIHASKPKRFDFSTEYQQAFHESYLKQIKERPFVGVTAVWAQSDFGSNTRGDSKPQVNQKGLQYFNRKPKDIYYYYQSVLGSKPVIHIASHDWLKRTSAFGEGQIADTIKIYTNLKTLDISVDGIKHQTLQVDQSNVAYFSFMPSKEQHKIEVKGKQDEHYYSDDIIVSYTDQNLSNGSSKEIAINVGATFQFTDENQKVWFKDQPYNNIWGYNSNNSVPLKFSKGIIGTKNEPIYQYYRKDISSYTVNVEAGLYEVDICLAELEYSESGKRKMDISINNKRVWKNLDLAKTYGKQTAVSRKFKVSVDGGEGITISLKAKRGKTILNGLYIKKLKSL
ncbi:glycoside hydrolase family 2 TIM barrel-domain containing protein [Flavivirga spongiicola]|uniref:Malectin domain-containing carbohydrate-binding protein n=1 Tax=Flavivirga spongiicola TaxID=421621 RepID=A0ABU7XWQ4_9FLAO|nr:glycoside hydrolase family 2 TIM barrel-domain containing protein [Flavivirga sp. MEBiC05379]MDO5980199.1 glycoside hydrolase family 2 TIM barrel-domain containing protein [Flavivirga sp. MEBiC05379]